MSGGVPWEAELSDAITTLLSTHSEIGIKALTRIIAADHPEWTELSTRMVRESALTCKEVLALAEGVLALAEASPALALPKLDILMEDVCRGVLAAWELHQPYFNLTYNGSSYTDATFKVLEEEHGAFARGHTSVQEWARGHEMTPSVWRAYWIARTNMNCLTLAGTLLATLGLMSKKGFTVIKSSNGSALDLSTARIGELAIFPHKVGSTHQGMMGLVSNPRGGKGDTAWHAFVEISSLKSELFVLDIAAAQFDVFGPEGQPFVILADAEYKERICSKHLPHPSPGAVTNSYVQNKISSMLQDMAKFVKHAKITPAECRMIHETCPFGLWSA